MMEERLKQAYDKMTPDTQAEKRMLGHIILKGDDHMEQKFTAQPVKRSRWSAIPACMALIAVVVLCAFAWNRLGKNPTEATDPIVTVEPSDGNKTVYPLPAPALSDELYDAYQQPVSFVEVAYLDDIPSICVEFFLPIEYAAQDIEDLQVGDTIMIDGNPVLIEEFYWDEVPDSPFNHWVINQGRNLETHLFDEIENGNYVNWMISHPGGARLQSISHATLPVSSDFIFIDYSTNIEYSFEELMALGPNPMEVLHDPYFTAINIENGFVTEMRCYFYGDADFMNDPTQDAIGEVKNDKLQEGCVYPLPKTLDINNLDNCTIAVAVVSASDSIYGDEIEVEVYTYDVYDMVDISNLQVGDTIMIDSKVVVIHELERYKYGVDINGGFLEEGYTLVTDESGLYYETGYNDVKTWQSVGTVTLPVSDDFILTDDHDPENQGAIYTYENLVYDEGLREEADFSPYNTTIVIEDGVVTRMVRSFMP